MPDNPSNGADLILDNCIQKLLNAKDNECLDIHVILSIVSEMMDELKENRRKNIDPSMCVDTDDEIIDTKIKSDDNTISINNSTLN